MTQSYADHLIMNTVKDTVGGGSGVDFVRLAS